MTIWMIVGQGPIVLAVGAGGGCLDIFNLLYLFIPNFKHLSQVVLKNKIFQYFYMYFYGSNLGPPARGHLGPWDLHLNKLINIFLCISMVRLVGWLFWF